MMRLSPEARGTSFYESFSDLIFGTMAIFLLLLLVVLGLIGEEKKQAEAEVQAATASLSKAEAEREAAREQLQEVVEELAKLEQAVKAQGLEVAIAVDTSGSMGEALTHLLETITTISTVMPRIAPEFRIGIVAYCKEQEGGQALQIYPMRQVVASSQDGGQSVRSLLSFTGSLAPKAGIAPVPEALRSAMGMMSPPNSFGGYQILFVLGDTGPFETTVNQRDVEMVEPHEIQTASQLTAEVARWVAASNRRRIVSLFSGAGQAQYPAKQQASREFFARLAADAGQPENFAEHPGKMLAYLLTAIVPER